ncbi:MAG: DNA polymerase III subunit alpha [Proteobacteria bacterium]|nr:DNA polymerase III subunit alpha [Pseudomonadota bacterium]
MSGFVHLHVHTQYSILDGAIRLPALFDAVAKRKVKAVAMTDHGVMHGAIDFINKSKPCKGRDVAVKPILGCEFNVTAAHPDSPEKIYHLTAICRTLKGYHNAMALLSRANIERHDALTGTSSIDFSWFRDHAEGLTILSGDLGSELAQTALRNGNVEGVLRTMRETFEDGQFYLEMMSNRFDIQKTVNQHFKAAAKKYSLPLVATNDCHYLTKDEAFAHAVLVCMALKKQIDVDVLRASVVDDFYLKTDEEMYAAFSDTPEACENTVKIAESVDCPVQLNAVYLPQYKVPETFLEQHEINDPKKGIDAYFKAVAREGLEKRLESFEACGKAVDAAVYWARLELELDVITQMGFPGYFLIVWDFIRWAKLQDIPVGPGRGSGAGSLVAYSLAITDLDPLPLSLLFERFLNPERVSMPDFDIDFCMDRRAEVIKYVTEHYGTYNVAQIATFGALKAKQSINSVGRVLNFLPSETRELTKLVPDDLNITLNKALKDEPKLKEIVDSDPQIHQLYDIATQLEDLYCQTGMHAAGIVISEGPLWDYVPIFRGANGEIVAQYAKSEVEQAGLIKFDFLGLKTLTVIQHAMRHVNRTRSQRGEPTLDINLLPLDDRGVYQMISSGKTTGVFQLESSGFKKLLMQLKPDCFEDIVAAVALYRPGPMGSGMNDQFVDCKHGLRDIVYPHELLRDILCETYGVIVYQEQVMQAAQVLAGYTLGSADIMRRAMGKKNPEEMAKQRSIFVEGAAQNGVDPQLGNEIFDIIDKFAGYGFNKSHSAAYALITYQTAYLKHRYPVEFYAALLTCDRDNPDKVIRTINDARQNRISILPPDVNESDLDFSVVEGRIRFGLGGIKGIGEAAIETILQARADGKFKSLFDFCERVDSRVNKRSLEALVMSGAFDSTWPKPLRHIGDIGAARASLFASLQTAMERSKQAREDKSAGQTSLFNLLGKGKETPALRDKYTEAAPWPEQTVLENEFSLIGFFVSGHPLDRYTQEAELFANQTTSSLGALSEGARVTLCGILKSVSVKTTKTGNKMLLGTLEDRSGQVGLLCFQRTLDQIPPDRFESAKPVVVSGKLKFQGEDEVRKPEIMIDMVETLESLRTTRVSRILFMLDADAHDEAAVKALAGLLPEGRNEPTACYLKVSLGEASAELRLKRSAKLTDDFLLQVDDILGMGNYQLK